MKIIVIFLFHFSFVNLEFFRLSFLCIFYFKIRLLYNLQNFWFSICNRLLLQLLNSLFFPFLSLLLLNRQESLFYGLHINFVSLLLIFKKFFHFLFLQTVFFTLFVELSFLSNKFLNFLKALLNFLLFLLFDFV